MSFDKLTDTEKKKMQEMQDDRSISGELLSAYIVDGREFNEFKKYVDGKKEFAVCMRGNSDPKCITIYHNNHMVWELSYDGKKYCVKVNFNHARYTSEWGTKLKELKGYFGMEDKCLLPKKTGENSASIDYIVCKKEKGTKFYTQDFVKGTAEIMVEVMKDFFNPYLQYDYFKKEALNIDYEKKDKTALVEKRWQQELFHYFKDTDNGIYVYDLEFSQKFPSSPDETKTRTNTIKTKLADFINEPDMLGIRFDENGMPKSLMLIEVKSTYSACENQKSGINKHLRGMWNYSQVSFFVERRRKEAKSIFDNLFEMNYVGKKYDEKCFETLPIERLMILTTDEVKVDNKIHHTEDGSAIKYYLDRENHKNKKFISVTDRCKEYKCSLWRVNGRIDETYTIEKIYECNE